jgi:pimeloyl-ACP methyl ester carboxylesterase
LRIAVPSVEGKLSDGDIGGGWNRGSRGEVPLAVAPPAGAPPVVGSPTWFTLLTPPISTFGGKNQGGYKFPAMRICKNVVFTAVLTVASLAPAASAFGATRPVVTQDWFYIGGHYIDTPGGQVLTGSMYTQVFTPLKVTHKYPIVLIHGGGGTGATYEKTPDGRPGWAYDYAGRGFRVYVVDQPARGRSILDTKVDGPVVRDSVKSLEQRLTLPETFNLWPQAKLHTQWPGAGKPGDKYFDAFIATRAMTLESNATMEELTTHSVVALLDRIGPAIVETHSQSGAYGWRIADARPKLVKALIQVEPNGPPYKDIAFIGPPDYFGTETVGRPWGLTSGPMTYAPAVSDPADLTFVQQTQADAPDLVRCWEQAPPAHQLPVLASVKILMVTSEASYHAPYDHCTSRFLDQAGVKHDYIHLAKLGIHGNAHDMMLEKNSAAISAVMANWLVSKGL